MDFRKEFRSTTVSGDFDGRKTLFTVSLDRQKPYRKIFCGIEWLGGITSAKWKADLIFTRGVQELAILPIERQIDTVAVTPVNMVLFGHPNPQAATAPIADGMQMDFVFDGIVPVTRFACPVYLWSDADLIVLRSNSHLAGAGTCVAYLAVLSNEQPFP